MVAVNDFSGLASSIWALASAAAMAPMVALERCIGELHIHQVKTDRARLRALGPKPTPGRLLGVLRHEFLQLGFHSFVREEVGPGTAEGCRELSPAVGRTHVDNANGGEPRPRRFDPEQPGLSALDHAAPEL